MKIADTSTISRIPWGTIRSAWMVRLADARRSSEDFGSIAAGLATLADGHHKFAFPRELENLIVIRKTRGVVSFPVCIPQDPHEVLVIHGDAMFVRRPLVSRSAFSAPGLDKVAFVVELHDGWCRNGYQVGRRGPRMRQTVWAAKDPNVILSVDCDIGPKSHPPL